MYLDHFRFKEFPFTLTPNLEFFCQLAGHQAAINTVLLSLRNGEGFIKVVGEVGTGKTLICRKLLAQLEGNFITAYIPNPDLSPAGLRKALAKELGIDKFQLLDQHALLELINQRLLELNAAGYRVVLLIDEAQALTTESLEALRLLTNLETEATKLLQVVLFGQPELDEKLNQICLRQLKQRISFSYHLSKITRFELEAYICHRLATAGYTRGSLFTPSAAKMLYRASRGVPRIINILCHKALMSTYGKGEIMVSRHAMKVAIRDSKEMIRSIPRWNWRLLRVWAN